MTSYFDFTNPELAEKLLRENGILSGSKSVYTKDKVSYSYKEEDFKRRIAQGSSADKQIFNFIRLGNADAFLMGELGYHLKFKANQIFANLDIMSREASSMADVGSLYETAGAGMGLVYMKNFISALWIIRCVVEKRKPDELLFEGLKAHVKRKAGDEYIVKLMERVFPRKNKEKPTQKQSQEQSQAELREDNPLKKELEDIKRRVGNLECNTRVANDLVHAVRNAIVNKDDEIQNINRKEEAMILLTNNEFMKVVQKAEKAGFLKSRGDWSFEWVKTKKELAVFAQVGSEKFNLSNKRNADGTPQINWKPFEVIFNVTGLNGTYNDMKNKGSEWPKNIKEIKSLYGVS